jgi:hypothetical protein
VFAGLGCMQAKYIDWENLAEAEKHSDNMPNF